MSLEEPLLNQDPSDIEFGVRKEKLMRLFETENRLTGTGEVSEGRKTLDNLGNSTGLLRALHSRENYGTEDSEAMKNKRINKFGTNERREIKTRGICEMIAEQFEDKILQILIAAALVSL